MGMTLDKVVYANSETREWYIQGAVDGVQFSLNIFCATNVKNTFFFHLLWILLKFCPFRR